MDSDKVEYAFKAHVDIFTSKAWGVEFVKTTIWEGKHWSSTYWFHIDEARDANDAINQAKSRWFMSRDPHIIKERNVWWNKTRGRVPLKIP